MKAVVRTLLWLGILVLVGSVSAIGYGLSLASVFTTTIKGNVSASPHQAWVLLSDYSGMGNWLTGWSTQAPNPGDSLWTATLPDGQRFHFHTYRSSPPEALVLEWVSLDRKGARGRWKWELEPLPGAGTIVKLTEEADLPSPMARILAKHRPEATRKRLGSMLKSLADGLSQK